MTRRGCPVRLLATCLLGLTTAAQAVPPPSPKTRPVTVSRICALISSHADRNGLSRDFFARLIWKESRFDPNAVSPAGAEGIAQFMPGTAKLRGLDDSFDIDEAIPASAAYLAELAAGFGNFGLAAAAYNAGESRVSRWLAQGGFLPLETENYVLDIFGAPADSFIGQTSAGVIPPLAEGKEFDEACEALPVTRTATVPMSSVQLKPWGVQLAGHFRRDVAIRQYQRVKGRFPRLLEDHEPVVSRVRSPIGRRGIHAVRIGVDDRASADIICRELRAAGGSCIVLRNR